MRQCCQCGPQRGILPNAIKSFPYVWHRGTHGGCDGVLPDLVVSVCGRHHCHCCSDPAVSLRHHPFLMTGGLATEKGGVASQLLVEDMGTRHEAYTRRMQWL